MAMQPMATQANDPWPPVQVLGRNPEYAEMLLSNVGGRNSEMSAVAHYRYNRLLSMEMGSSMELLSPAEDYSALSELFHKISMVEMHHMDSFAQLAMRLGADPRMWHCCNCRMQYWSPSYVDYCFCSLREMVQKVLGEELAAIEKYNTQAACIGDPNVAAILRRVVKDEEAHVETWRAVLAGL